MATIQDLIKINYKDMTRYPSASGGDCLSVILPYYWGKIEKQVLNQGEFLEQFPEVLPPVPTITNSHHFFDAYLQIKDYFENGGTSIEVERPILDDAQVVPVKSDGEVLTTLTGADYYLTTKYVGAIPSSLLPDSFNELEATDKKLKLAVEGTGTTKTVKLYYNNKGSDIIVESWKGQFYDESLIENGQNTHFISVLQNSKTLRCIKPYELEAGVTADVFDATTDDFGCTWATKDLLSTTIASKISTMLSNDYQDLMSTKGTIFISPVNNSAFDSHIKNIVTNLNSAIGILGFNSTISKSNVETYLDSSQKDKLIVQTVGTNITSIFGNKVQNNCVGAYAGALVNIANTQKLNQIPSAFTYGGISAVVITPLSFSEAVELGEKGIVSIIVSQGKTIAWGVNNTLGYSNNTTYFSKINIMRVCTSLISRVIPECYKVLHTPVSSNPTERSTFESLLNSLVDSYKPDNLKDNSRAICDASINTDALTRGGQDLNIVLELWFMKLTERITINVVATDSSVTATIA